MKLLPDRHIHGYRWKCSSRSQWKMSARALEIFHLQLLVHFLTQGSLVVHLSSLLFFSQTFSSWRKIKKSRSRANGSPIKTKTQYDALNSINFRNTFSGQMQPEQFKSGGMKLDRLENQELAWSKCRDELPGEVAGSFSALLEGQNGNA